VTREKSIFVDKFILSAIGHLEGRPLQDVYLNERWNIMNKKNRGQIELQQI